MPESPRWLVSKGKIEEARKVLHKIRSPEDNPVIIEYKISVKKFGPDFSVHINRIITITDDFYWKKSFVNMITISN